MRNVVVAVVLLIAILLGVVAQGGKAPKAPVDLNRATPAELMTLPGVGETKAQAIVRHRALHPFTRTSDLLKVKGFGRGLYARLRPFLTLGSSAAQAPGAPPPASSASSSRIWPGAAGVLGRPPWPSTGLVPRSAARGDVPP